MTCAEFIEFLMEYDDGRLPPEVCAQFDDHLANCPDCVNYLASYRTTKALGRSVFADPATELPPTVPAELIRAILALRSAVEGELP